MRHEEAKLKGQGPGLLEFKGQGPEMVNVEELCWCVRPYTQRTFTSPGPWPLNVGAQPRERVVGYGASGEMRVQAESVNGA